MKRKIVDYKKLTPDILSMLVEKYPYGYDDGHIISFSTAHDEIVEAVEVRTEDTIYLVKVSTKLVAHMANFNRSMYEEADMHNPDAVIELPEVSEEDIDK